MKFMNEVEIRTNDITHTMKASGWQIGTQLREEVPLTAGPVIVRGQLVTHAKKKFADYVLYYKPNIPIAIVEAKDNKHAVSSGIHRPLSTPLC